MDRLTRSTPQSAAYSAPCSVLEAHFRIPPGFFDLGSRGPFSEAPGKFRFGPGVTCYGRFRKSDSSRGTDAVPDLMDEVQIAQGKCQLPFDPGEAAENVRRETYAIADQPALVRSAWIRKLYYALRPLLPVAVRRHAQRRALRGFEQRSFPAWPVDRSVDSMLDRVLAIALRSSGADSVPFIWFWPEDKQACVLMTHDVETRRGLKDCADLMALNQSFGIPASFQLIPHGRYRVTPQVLDGIQSQGFEVNLHDWNHDGSLFRNERRFPARAKGINAHAAKWKVKGFRSGALYRNADWLQSLDVEYDMSVPVVAHLDPQSGGCCTIFPWFNGSLLEIPVTMVQDYSLFHILTQYSLDLWKRQLEIVLAGHGLASFIVHPDYIQDQRSRDIYRELLALLNELHHDRNLWVTMPGEVNSWWRQRSQMKLERKGEQWKVTGPGSERARVAFASLQDGNLVYSFSPIAETVAS
jgi:hypothetical protein